MLAYCSLVYVASALLPNPSHFRATLDWFEIGDDWLAVQALSAGTLGVGALIPRRSLLHIGLALSGFTWAAMTVALAAELDLSPGSLLFPFFAVMSMVLLVDDVRRRPTRV